MLHYEFYYYTEDYFGETRKKNQLRNSKKANVLLIKFFYTVQDAEAASRQCRNKAITIPVYTRSVHRVQTHV